MKMQLIQKYTRIQSNALSYQVSLPQEA